VYNKDMEQIFYLSSSKPVYLKNIRSLFARTTLALAASASVRPRAQRVGLIPILHYGCHWQIYMSDIRFSFVPTVNETMLLTLGILRNRGRRGVWQRG
jgi:hypothetical protein